MFNNDQSYKIRKPRMKQLQDHVLAIKEVSCVYLPGFKLKLTKIETHILEWIMKT